jgi:hypothetical protein
VTDLRRLLTPTRHHDSVERWIEDRVNEGSWHGLIFFDGMNGGLEITERRL